MPELLDDSLRVDSFDLVVNDDLQSFFMEHEPPAMEDPSVAAGGSQRIEFVIADPFLDIDVGLLQPSKRTGGLSLILAIDANGVVCG